MAELIKIKVDFHIHSSEDYVETVMEKEKLPTPEEYIYKAKELGFDAISFTNHSTWFDEDKYSSVASRNGIILFPGIEMCINRKHVLLYNFPKGSWIESFEQLKALKNGSNLVIAAHPYFWAGKCLGGELEKNIALFDGIEISHFFTEWFDLNTKAAITAKKHNLPLLSFSDSHKIRMFGRNHAFLYVREKSVKGIIDAVKARRVENVAPPMKTHEIIFESFSKLKYLRYVFGESPEEKFIRLNRPKG
ncbi:MAG: PHP domain-containing protein [Candidatus Aureabacteria bacterium]|nr:PHP domain-containing protein [Candidatus Auribacterota bacterium]